MGATWRPRAPSATPGPIRGPGEERGGGRRAAMESGSLMRARACGGGPRGALAQHRARPLAPLASRGAYWRSPVTACSALVDGARECHVTLALAFSTHKRDAEGSLTLPNTLFCHTCRPARRAVCGLLAVAGQSSRLSTLTIVTGQASRPARQPRSKPRCNNSSYGRSAPLRGASNTSGISGAISRNVYLLNGSTSSGRVHDDEPGVRRGGWRWWG